MRLGAWLLSVVALGALASPSIAEAKKVRIKLGTLAPEGSQWHNVLKRMGERWEKASNGEVELKVYAGGVAGDESDMVRKIRVGQLHAALLTPVGLGQVSRSTMALAIPMMYDSWEQLDYVRDHLTPKLEQEMDKNGMVVLQWGDAGWIHQFCKTPCKTPDELRKLKMFVWSGDPESEKAWRTAKFNPVPLSATDMMSALQTGMIEAFGTTPLIAMTSTWYQQAKQMTKINWAPLNGGTIVAESEWEKIDEKLRPELLKISREEGLALRTEIRAMSENAVKAMTDRGLVVATPDAAGVEEWRKAAQMGWPDIRGKIIPAEFFDEAKRLAEEFNKTKK